MQPPLVVKLGGSAITDKSRLCTPKVEVIHRAIDEIATYRKPLILLHGGGSFAHPFITRAMINNRFRGRSEQSRVSEIELNLDQLTRILGVALQLRQRAFVPMLPMSFLTLMKGEVRRHFLHPVNVALDSGLIPLIHGDLAMDERGGCGIISADRIASLLGKELGVSRVLFGCDVEGVYTGDPKGSEMAALIPRVERRNSAQVLKGLSSSLGDATGGMLGKVREALRLAKGGYESYIFKLDGKLNLRELLNGSVSIGTRFVPWRQLTQTKPS